MRRSFSSLVRWSGFIAIGLLISSSHGVAQQFEDTVVLTDGTRDAKVSVVSEDFQEVVYQLAGGTEKKVAAEDVVDIEYGNAPGGLRSGYDLWRRGRFEAAASTLRSVSGSMGPGEGSELAETYANYYLGDSRLSMGGQTNCQAAGSAFQSILADSTGAQSRFCLRAQVGLGNARLGAGDLSGAQEAFEALAADPRLGNLPDGASSRYRVEAQLGLADVHAGQGNTEDAESALQAAQSSALAAGDAYDSLVRLRLAEIHVASGAGSQVQNTYESGAAAASAEGVNVSGEEGRMGAVALAALGLARIGGGQLLEARPALARVSVHFYEHGTCHAASLFYTGLLYRKMQERYTEEAEQMTDDDEKSRREAQAETASKMSTQYFNTLLDRHPRSRWARRYRSGDLG